MNRLGWIIYNGYLSEDKFLDYAETMQAAASKKKIKMDIIKNNQLFSVLGEREIIFLNGKKHEKPDFVLFLDKDTALAWQLEHAGIPVFNSADAIELCDNKISTYQRLIDHQLPIPKTILAPKMYAGADKVAIPHLGMTIEKLGGFPIILKEAYGSYGEQVYLVQNAKELESKINEIKEKPFLFQEFLTSSIGRDLRLNVVGDQVVASMLRSSNHDFRANAPSGKSEAYQPSSQEKELAVAASKAVGTDFAGVDLLFGKDGPVICEVNSNAHIRKTFESTGIDVAEFIINYIDKSIS